jgi:hypothetical protein
MSELEGVLLSSEAELVVYPRVISNGLPDENVVISTISHQRGSLHTGYVL